MKNRLIALLVLFTVTFFVSSAQAQTTARKFEAGKNTFLVRELHKIGRAHV